MFHFAITAKFTVEAQVVVSRLRVVHGENLVPHLPDSSNALRLVDSACNFEAE